MESVHAEESPEQRERQIAELCRLIRQERSRLVESNPDYDLILRVKDFKRARFLRHETYNVRPYGIFGLFQHLAEIRLDLEWAEDAAWRRKNGKAYFSWMGAYLPFLFPCAFLAHRSASPLNDSLSPSLPIHRF
jgi:hypothetical protein